MRIKGYIVALFILSFPHLAQAQDNMRIFEAAQEAYEYGLFQKADSLLSQSAGSFSGEARIRVAPEHVPDEGEVYPVHRV